MKDFNLTGLGLLDLSSAPLNSAPLPSALQCVTHYSADPPHPSGFLGAMRLKFGVQRQIGPTCKQSSLRHSTVAVLGFVLGGITGHGVEFFVWGLKGDFFVRLHHSHVL